MRKRPVSLEGSKNQARAPSTGAGDTAPDGAAAPRAGARAALETGRGVTGSLPSGTSPEIHAGASLCSRMLRLREGSRARVGLEPEPKGHRQASGRKDLAVPEGGGFRCAGLTVAGARGGGASPRACALWGRRRRGRVHLSPCLPGRWPGKAEMVAYSLFFPPPAHGVWVSGWESGFWKSLWKVSGLGGKISSCIFLWTHKRSECPQGAVPAPGWARPLPRNVSLNRRHTPALCL